MKDEDGITMKSGDYFTFSFGIPPICVLAQITGQEPMLGYQCLFPEDVKPKSGKLSDLTKYYQVWKAGKARVESYRKAYSTGQRK